MCVALLQDKRSVGGHFTLQLHACWRQCIQALKIELPSWWQIRKIQFERIGLSTRRVGSETFPLREVEHDSAASHKQPRSWPGWQQVQLNLAGIDLIHSRWSTSVSMNFAIGQNGLNATLDAE